MKKLLFLLPFYLFSAGVDPDCIISQKDFPLVNGLVDPLSGALVYNSCDHEIKGAESLYFSKSYGTEGETKYLEGGWNFFPELFLRIERRGDEQKCDPKEAEVFLIDLNRKKHFFYFKKTLDKDTYLYKSVANLKQDSYRNTIAGELSGRSNPRNMELEVVWEKSATLSSGDGSKKKYEYYKGKGESFWGPNERFKYRLIEEVKPNKNRIKYLYDKLGRVEVVQSMHPSEDKLYASYSLKYQDQKHANKNRNFSIHSGGKKIGEYHFWRPGEKKEDQNKDLDFIHNSFYLENFFHRHLEQNLLNQTFDYDDGEKKKSKSERGPLGAKHYTKRTRGAYLTKINQDGVSYQIEYYGPKDFFNIDGREIHIKHTDDHRCDRVKKISLIGDDSKPPIPLYLFEYELKPSNCEDKEKVIRKTRVKNLVNNDLLIFHFNEEKLPTKFEHIYANGFGKRNYFIEEYLWKEDKNSYQIDAILQRGKKNSDASITIGYSYDRNGNVKRIERQGNLTGGCNKNHQKSSYENTILSQVKTEPLEGSENKSTITLRGRSYPVQIRYPEYNSNSISNQEGLSIECTEECKTGAYFIGYTYSDDGFNLPKTKKEGNGLFIEYTYKKNTNLMTSKIISDSKTKKILQRQFFKYNKDNVLVRKILDNGTSSKDDLSGTIRKETAFTPRKTFPINLPDSINESYIEDGKRIVLQRKKFTYNDQALVEKEEVFSPSGTLLYFITNKYAENGLLLSSTDPIGRETKYTYDQNGARFNRRIKTLKEGIKPYLETYSYDHTGNIAEKTLIGNVERQHVYKNNLLGHKESETDFRNNTTTFSCDGRGNVVTKSLPSAKEDPITTKKKYDVFGRVICSIDAEENKTLFKYNSYGSVTQITYPDNSTEHFIYELNGFLNTHIDQEGVETNYTYDVLGNELTKIISKDGKILAFEKREYNGFAVSFFQDAEGNKVHYFYDGSGRKIAEEFCHGDKTERKEYTYDDYGFLYSEKICNGKNSLLSITTRDPVGRVLEERQEDESGNIYNKVTYTYYDEFDNKKTETRFIDGKKVTTRFEYDDFNRLFSQKDEEENEYLTEYFDYHTNDLNQTVLQTISTDPLGVRTVENYNVLDQVSSTEKFSPSGMPLSLEEFFMDKRGNLANQKSTIFSEGSPIRTVERHQFYNKMNRLEQLVEAANIPDEKKVTEYLYKPKGQLETVIKPNKIELLRTYDFLGNEKTLTSSDNTINYEYEYNKLGHQLSSRDRIKGLMTTRTLDGRGRMLFEALRNGLTIEFEYDLAGRLKKTTLFDGSTIEKEYDPAFLKRVTRKDSNGNTIHTHEFIEYDLSGNLLKEGFDQHQITYSFDHLGRVSSLTSPNFSQIIDEYDANGKIKKMRINDESYIYEYDDLEQLTSEKGRFSHDYLFDSHNNCLQKDGADQLVNHLNQIILTEDNEYTYDDNGNTLFKNQDTKYIYDALDRLVCIEQEEPVEYIYDSFHRRIKKIEKEKETLYLYSGENEIGEIVGKKIQKLRTLGLAEYAELGAAISIEIDNELYIPIHDLSLNVASLLSSDQEVLESYCYSAFGQEEVETPFTTPINPWRYSSKRTDPETDFVYFGRRYYDPELGRWTTKDPKGYEEGINLYAYVLNSPLLQYDLYGLEIFINPIRIDPMFIGPIYVPRVERGSTHEELRNQAREIRQSEYLKRACKSTVDYHVGLVVGMGEAFTGINAPFPNGWADGLGRITGRTWVDYISKVAKRGGPWVSGAGVAMECLGVGAIAGSGGAAIAVGGSAISGGKALAAGGVAIGALGYLIEENIKNLDEIDLTTLSKSKKVNSGSHGDKYNTPESHPEEFNRKDSTFYRNKKTKEIWQKSDSNHSGSKGGEWKVGINKGKPSPNKKHTLSRDGKFIKTDCK